MLTRILPFTLAAAWVTAAAPVHAYDPSDPAGPSPDDPSAWVHIGERDAAPVAHDEPCAPSVGGGYATSNRAERLDCRCDGGAARPRHGAAGLRAARGAAVDSPAQRKEEVMSALIVSSLMATALAAVPPWFGSEPYVFGFDDVPPRAQTQVAPTAPTFATSLGSEPFLAGPENAPSPRAVSTVAPQSARPTLATSLGSEPFILGDSGAAGVTPREDAGTHSTEWRVGHNEGPFMDDGLDWSPPRRVPVVIAEDGPLPNRIEVYGREKIELVVERSSPNACRAGLVLGGHDLRAPAPDAQPTVITVLAYGGVARLDLTCPADGATDHRYAGARRAP